MARRLKAVIAGGGIGGLTAAIALRRAGIDVEVHERAGHLQEIGAGIALASNAMKVLAVLGLAEGVQACGAQLAGGAIRTSRGGVIVRAADEARAFINVCVHRVDLQGVLVGALGEAHIRSGSELVGFYHRPDAIVAEFAGGHEAEGDVLVGADGLHSRVRTAIHGPEKPRYAGYTAWRGIAAVEIDGFESTETWGRGKRFGIVPIGGGRVYWFATKNAPEGEPERPERRQRELLELFKGWHQPIEAVIGATAPATILRHDLYDRKPLKRPWGQGRVTLLGDAAHPSTPNLGQGACQAIEDAVVLAHHLRGAAGIEAALRSYEDARAARTAYITNLSWRLGTLSQLENPVACRVRDAVLRAVPFSVQRRQLEKVVRFEPDALE